MISINQVTLLGFITQDAQLVNNDQAVRLRVATNHAYKDSNGHFQEKARFNTVFVNNPHELERTGSLKKGDRVHIEGIVDDGSIRATAVRIDSRKASRADSQPSNKPSNGSYDGSYSTRPRALPRAVAEPQPVFKTVS